MLSSVTPVRKGDVHRLVYFIVTLILLIVIAWKLGLISLEGIGILTDAQRDEAIEDSLTQLQDFIEDGCRFGSANMVVGPAEFDGFYREIDHVALSGSDYMAMLRDGTQMSPVSVTHCADVGICASGTGLSCTTGGQLPGGQPLRLQMWYEDVDGDSQNERVRVKLVS